MWRKVKRDQVTKHLKPELLQEVAGSSVLLTQLAGCQENGQV